MLVGAVPETLDEDGVVGAGGGTGCRRRRPEGKQLVVHLGHVIYWTALDEHSSYAAIE